MFSVLISVYHKEQPDYLRQSLDSIFSQTVLPDEVILVEDGPLMEALDSVIKDYCCNYPILKTVSLIKNQGLGNALDEGLKHCSYDIVARMDSDDICVNTRFEKQLKILECNSEIDVVGSWVDEFEETVSHIISTRRLLETHEEIVCYAKHRSPLNHPTVMFRKQAVIAAGGYKHFPLFEDYHLWVRMLRNGAKFYNCQESLLYFRVSPEMFKRRGGIRYALNEIKLQKEFKKMGFISTSEFYQNVIVRFISRIIPNVCRIYLYKNVLRK